MKTKLLLFLLFFFHFTYSQNPENKKIFFDSEWNETEEGKHTYYRIIEDYNIEKPLHRVLDYYRNDTLQMKGLTSSLEKIVKEGPYSYYYENGKKKSLVNFEDDKVLGKELRWYENGNKESDGDYTITDNPTERLLFTVNQYWNKDGKQKVIDGNGDYEEYGGNFSTWGRVKNGLRHGEWKGEDKSVKIRFVEKYKDGKFISGISTDSLNVKHKYDKLVIRPKAKNGIEHFLEYISNGISSNKDVEGQTGRVFVLFYIGMDCNPTDVKILESAGSILDEQAIRLILNYKEWECGYYKGIKFKHSFTVPILFE